MNDIMARAVEASTVMIMGDPSPQKAMERLKIQNSYLAHNITKYLLKTANLNGLHRQSDHRFTHEVINETGFKAAVSTLENACLILKETKDEEMGKLVATLDITDSQLCANFQRVSHHLMAEEIRFGRIVSLFFFTYVLSKRLHLNGRQREIESVVDWLAQFLNDVIAPWLIQNHSGNWAAIKDSINTDVLTSNGTASKGPGGWWTMAALGMGAFVVGALAFRS